MLGTRAEKLLNQLAEEANLFNEVTLFDWVSCGEEAIDLHAYASVSVELINLSDEFRIGTSPTPAALLPDA